MAEPTEIRKKKARARFPLHWILIPAVVVLAAGAVAWWLFRPAPASGGFVLPGYITSLSDVRLEYEKYQKKPEVPGFERQFQKATNLMARHNPAEAALVLEEVVKQAQLPAIYNNLGVLYAETGDRSRTLNAFRAALARDAGYAPARKNLERLKDFASETRTLESPVTREVEPNNTLALANLIAVGTPVDAEISANMDDVDCFKLEAPAGPRDILKIEVANHSPNLAPKLALYDANQDLKDPVEEFTQPGGTLTRSFSAPPKAMVYLKIWGGSNSSGGYGLTVRAAGAFDRLEPNDDILTAHRINLGEKVDANIMDSDDTDYYSFLSPRKGKVSIQIDNRSKSLIPALTTFTPDMRHSGFGPDVRRPGLGLHHTIAVEAGQVYFLQVWSQLHTSGNYSLTVN